LAAICEIFEFITMQMIQIEHQLLLNYCY
jgi:hypothetical protein